MASRFGQHVRNMISNESLNASTQFNNTRAREAANRCGITLNGANIYMFSKFVFVLGVVANAVVISRVILDKRLRCLTFTVIACLAFSDMVYLTLNIVEVADRIVRLLLCTKRSDSLTWSSGWTGVLGASWFAASVHILFISAVRYIILVYPLKAYIIISSRRVIALSLLIWVSGAVVFGTFEATREFLNVKAQTSFYVYVPLWMVVYIISVVTTVVLHVVKMLRVHETVEMASNMASQKLLLRMARIIMVVVLLAILLPLPKFIVGVLAYYDIVCGYRECQAQLRNISNILFLLNHCVNPFIYAFMSEEFRKSLKRVCIRNIRRTRREAIEGSEHATQVETVTST